MDKLRVAGAACVALLMFVGAGELWLPLTRSARVSFGVVDGLGRGNLRGGTVKSFKNLKTGRDLAKHFHLNRFLWQEATGVPYGSYDLKFDQPGFPERERPVQVAQHEVDFEVCVRTATVHIVPVYTFGKYSDLEAEVKSFKNDEYALDLASSFKRNTATNVPYGTYELRVENPAFFTVKQQADVFQPEVWVLIQPIVGSVESTFPAPTVTLSGTVKNLDPDEEPIYIRLVDVFPGTAFSAAVDTRVAVSGNSGTFTLTGTPSSGEYSLVTFGRSGILDFRRIEVTEDFTRSIVIDLGRNTKNVSGTRGPN